jgi:hypothetical protein
MGRLSKWELERDHLPSLAMLFGGNTSRSSIERIVGRYERVVFHKHDNYEPFLVDAGGREALLVFQLYGAPLVADLLHVFGDGGTKSAIFLGAAYGIQPELQIADCVVPTKVRCLDGFTQTVGATEWSHPDADMRQKVIAALQAANECFSEGPTVSVPSTFYHGDESLLPPNALVLEIELGAFFHVGAATAIRCAAVLVVSDNATHSLQDSRTSRDERLIGIFNALRELDGL